MPIKVAKQMGTGWQPPHDENEIENNLMKDPFLLPRFESKPKVVFTRSKIIGNRDFELKVRPQNTATRVTLTEQDLGSTLQFKVKRECRETTPNGIFARKRSPASPSFERQEEPLFDDHSSEDQGNDILQDFQDAIRNRITKN